MYNLFSFCHVFQKPLLLSFAGKKVEQEVKVVQLKKLIEFFLVSEVNNINSQCLVKNVFISSFCYICGDISSKSYTLEY